MINNVGLTDSEMNRAKKMRAAGWSASDIARSLKATCSLIETYFQGWDSQAAAVEGKQKRSRKVANE